MDKQTAIDLLDNLLGMVEDNHESDYDAALHMGIDALKMQLLEEDATKDATFDYIDRQANCDYCHEDSDGYVRPIERNAHAVLFKGVLRIKGYGYKWDVKINYYPMCGRRLTDG